MLSKKKHKINKVLNIAQVESDFFSFFTDANKTNNNFASQVNHFLGISYFFEKIKENFKIII